MSLRISWVVLPAPSAASESFGAISKIVLKILLHCVVLKPISAFGCNP